MQGGRSRRRERGVAAIAMALMTVAVAGAAVVSFMLTRAQDTQGRVSGQADLLNWADSAVRTFALSNGRLPCPASERNGPEDCTVGSTHFAKGWLPVASLMTVAPQDSGRVITSDIRYLVNSGPWVDEGRGTDSDLTTRTTPFRPRMENGEDLKPYEVPLVPSDLGTEGLTVDLCGKLLNLNRGWQRYQQQVLVNGNMETVNKFERWRITGDAARAAPSNPFQASELAYGVAVSAQGAPREASASNANFRLGQLESPLRPRDPLYQDMVRITRPAQLYDAFGCAGAIASLDTLLVVHGWSGVNEGNRRGSIKFGDQFIGFTELGLTADTIGLTLDGIDAGIAVYNGAFNATKLAQAAANFAVEFPFIPVHITGMALAVAGGVQSAINMGFSIGAVFMDSYYLDGYRKFRQMQRDTTVWTGALPMLLQAHQLGISPVVVPNPVMPGLPPPQIPDDIGVPR